MSVGAISAFVAPEPESDITAKHQHPGFFAAVVAPIKEMVTRLGSLALPILLMIAGFRMPGYISSAMALPLFKSLNYSNTDIATVTKLYGFWIALAATFFSAHIIRKIGMMRSLLVGTVAGSASHLSLAWLAADGGNVLALRCYGRHRRVCLCLCASGADQLHVLSHRDGTRRKPIRPFDLALRLTG